MLIGVWACLVKSLKRNNENEGRFVKSGEGGLVGLVMVLAICGCVC